MYRIPSLTGSIPIFIAIACHGESTEKGTTSLWALTQDRLASYTRNTDSQYMDTHADEKGWFSRHQFGSQQDYEQLEADIWRAFPFLMPEPVEKPPPPISMLSLFTCTHVEAIQHNYIQYNILLICIETRSII